MKRLALFALASLALTLAACEGINAHYEPTTNPPANAPVPVPASPTAATK